MSEIDSRLGAGNLFSVQFPRLRIVQQRWLLTKKVDTKKSETVEVTGLFPKTSRCFQKHFPTFYQHRSRHLLDLGESFCMLYHSSSSRSSCHILKQKGCVEMNIGKCLPVKLAGPVERPLQMATQEVLNFHVCNRRIVIERAFCVALNNITVFYHMTSLLITS